MRLVDGVRTIVVEDCEDARPDAEILADRDCYCEPGGAGDRGGGAAPRHCATCHECGKPGHLCHYPGPMPFTGNWCDEHYIREARTMALMRECRRAAEIATAGPVA
jgi:hypothetical protein